MKCVEEADRLSVVSAAERKARGETVPVEQELRRVIAAMEAQRTFEEKHKPCAAAMAEKDLGKMVQTFAWF